MDKKDEALWIQTLWNPLEEIYRSPLSSNKEGVRVAAYCRVSYSPRGVPESLINQISQYTHKIAGQQNWKFVGIYFDNQVTGRKASLRHGFTRMLRHCEEGKIDLILVKSVSRFSRNAKELIEIVNRLKDLKVTVYFETENIETTNVDSTYLLKTYAAFAQGEIEELSTIIEWGHEKQFARGVPLLGNLYGYSRMTKHGERKIRIKEDEAQIVREIFSMFIDGKSYTEISNILTERRIKTKYGKDIWTSSIIKSILMNTSYTGNYIARRKKRDLFTDQYQDSKGVRAQYFIENSHPGIIDSNIFNAVQKIIEDRGSKKFNIRERHNSALTSRVLCGNCNRNYSVIDRPPQPRRQCPTNKKNSLLCPAPILREYKIKEMLLRSLENRFKLEHLSDIRRMEKLIKTINNNDNFEFHRLKAITNIDSARKMIGIEFTVEDVKNMENAYEAFEDQLIRIEDDRQYRVEALNWLKTVDTITQFKEQVTIANMRALISEIVVFTDVDYIVRWVDGEETEIGYCIPAERVTSSDEIEKGHKIALPYYASDKSDGHMLVNENQEIIEIDSKTQQSDKDEGKEGNDLEVVKIEPTVPRMLLAQLQKSLNKYKPIDINLPQNSKRKLRVAAYVRVSTDMDEQAHSFKAQLAFYSFYLLQHPNYEMVGIYADEGISGTSTKNRKEFNRMINDCKDGKIDMIITKSISRFARNTVDIIKYTRMLSELDPPVFVHFERENLNSKDLKSQVLITLLGSLSQEESVNLAHSVAWSKRNSASRGIVKPGLLGYGYKYGRNNEWLIIDDEANVVKRIYREFLEGKSKRSIAHELTSERVKTPEGQQNWSLDTIKKILSSERYCGDYLFQKYYSNLSPDNKVLKNNGEKEMYFLEAHHNPIIDKEQWEQVQEILKNRRSDFETRIKNHYKKANGKNEIFNKHLSCGKCGSTVVFARTGSEPYSYPNWRCGNGYLGYCTALSFNQEYLEYNFMQLLMDMKFSSAFEEHLMKLRGSLNLSEEEQEKKEFTIECIRELTQQLHKAVAEELEKKGKDAKRIDDLTNEILELRSKISIFDKRQEQLKTIIEHLELIETTLREFVDSRKDEFGFYSGAPKFINEIFAELVEEGILNEDGRVVYRLKLGIDWAAPTNYNDYKLRTKYLKKRKRQAEMERYLEGPEIKALIRYCKQARSLEEMHKFVGRYAFKTAFKSNIVDPLIEKGLIKRTFPEKPTSKNQRYYSIEAE